MRSVFLFSVVWASLVGLAAAQPAAKQAASAKPIPPLPANARAAFTEDWATGAIDPKKWYVLRKKWGDGNHGVVPENVAVTRDQVDGREQHVLVCTAHGDQYDGPVVGLWGKRERVGGVIVSKGFYASGRYQVQMKVGSAEAYAGGPANPAHPSGTVPAVWTFAYRWVEAPRDRKADFLRDKPLYNPHMPAYGIAANEYWSELDFPEFGKNGAFATAMYNTFCQNRHESKTFDIGFAADGQYHTYVTEWRTALEPFAGITDAQTVEAEGFWWIQDKAVPFDKYFGNPLKRLGPNEYAVYTGVRADHWVDGKYVGENTKFVPVMAAQLNLGVWLPKWAGPAAWKTSRVSFGKVQIWQYDDAGDVRGVLKDDLKDNFDKAGKEVK